MPFGTWVPQDELDRPQRNALQQVMGAMAPPGLAQGASMLQEHFRSLGPVQAAERTADDLMGVFRGLGPLGAGDLANPVQFGARVGQAATRGVTEALAPAGEAVDRYQQEQRRPLDTTLQALRVGDETPEETAATGRKWLEAGEALAGAGPDTSRLVGAAGRGLRNLATGIADEAAGLGIRRGQRGVRMQPLTPEQQAARAADMQAEEEIFSAIQRLWRMGADGEAAADDLRFLSMGKGRQGLAAMRDYLTERGLDVSRIVPEGVARRMAGEVRLPDDSLFREAVENTPGAAVTPDGLKVDLFRWQKPGQAGSAADRVFYMARDAEDYADQAAFGGSQRIAGSTIFRRPYVVTGETGGQAIGRAADEVFGAYGASDMGYPAQRIAQTLRGDADDVERVRGWLSQHGGDPGSAEAIVRGAVSDANHADHATRLYNGMMENALAAELRRRGYDGLVGVGGRGRFHLTEVMDVRESQFPGPSGEYGLRPEFRPGGVSGASGLRSAAAEAVGPAGIGARAAATRGERAFDLASGTAGGIAGAATADEDATWQERLGRGVVGAALGAPAGASARALARGLPGAAASGIRRPSMGEVADVATSAPLLRPTSLINNAVSGGFRTAQRWLEESAGAAAVDRSLRESLDDLGAMAAEVPAALRQFGQTFRQGGTQSTRSQLGAGGESLVTDPSKRAQVLTAGTRLNVATDEFWRTINEAGAIARAQTRGLPTADAAAKGADAADFVSFAGKASRLADYLGGYRRVLNDPDASGPAKAFAAGMVSVTPYIKTPERVLLATGRLLGDPVALPLSALSKNSLVRAAMRGDPEAKREVAGRLLVSGMTYLTALGAYASGQLHGAPPKDATLRRQMEAEGAQWDSLLGVPLRSLGVFGQAMGGLATALEAAERTAAKGADPSDVVRSFFSESARWALEDSYLRGLSDFDRAVREGRGAQEVERMAADAVTRPLSGLAGMVDPFDPYEREKRGTGAELLEGLPGGRFALPTRVDPATGEPVRREGSGARRLVQGSLGVAESPEARELARLGVTAREFKPQDKAFGQIQTPEARRALQETYGRYARDYIRDTMARPDYKGASPEEQAATLERQLGLAETLASIEVGDRVARDPEARFELEWLRTPQYRGVEGNPTQVARQNLEIREAKALLAEYQRRHGETAGRYRFYEEHPDLIDSARRPEIPARALAEEREAVRRRTGAPDTRDRALPGAGNQIVPAPTRSPAFTAP